MKKRFFSISALVIALALLGSCSSQPSEESTVPTSSPILAEETQVIDSEPAVPPVDDATLGEKNALAAANTYLSFSAFSAQGLIDQLEFEGYTTQEAQYAVAKCGADWNEQAAKKAQAYLDFSSFSREGLIDQLLYEGFTQEQAEYGVTAVGY